MDSKARPSFESNEATTHAPVPPRRVDDAANPAPLRPARHEERPGAAATEGTAGTAGATAAAPEEEDTLSKGLDEVDSGITGAWHMFQGAGEQIRGGINRFVDQVGDRIAGRSPDKNKARNDATINQGEEQISKGMRVMDGAEPIHHQ